MNHPEAEALLIDLVAGALDPEHEEQVRNHQSGCSECSAWLEAYSVLSEELTSRDLDSPSHPNSHDVATFALLPDSLGEFDRARVARHLQQCSSCAAEVRMVELSAEESSIEAETPSTAALSSVPGLSRPSSIGLAAMLLLFFGVLLVTQLPDADPFDLTLDGGRLDGRETISATRSINVKETAVTSGTALTLKSQSVAFGEGFSIEESAALVVVTETALEDS